ncbi:MAG: UDP-3-O-(3-hydroxymyristoyl)glucosamine N-acyltransferase [Nitrospirae bacterium]|nr:MAG: UDP-3-O-(3-hydroxymyristoyl)glucosamine N-acyltransferase [Nitrospirota bacterium]
MKLSEIAHLLGGVLIGDGDIEIKGVRGIEDAQEGDITLFTGGRYREALLNTKASAVITKERIKELEIPLIVVKNPYRAFAEVLKLFEEKFQHIRGVSQKAFVSSSAEIEEDVTIYPGAHIGPKSRISRGVIIYAGVYIGEKTSIGEESIIYPNVTIREKVEIGKRVIIHPGAVIGADGFGYLYENGVHHKIPQIGGVIIGDDVEIGANTTIDRATTGYTIIGDGTKIDNLVQIAHNVKIGKNCIIVSQTGISGSCVIGDNVTLAGQVGISDHVEIVDGVIIGAKSGVSSSIKKPGAYSGIAAIPHKRWLRCQAIYSKLPELLNRIREIEKQLQKQQERTMEI